MQIKKSQIYILSGILGIVSLFITLLPKFIITLLLSVVLIVLPLVNIPNVEENFTFEVSPEREKCMKENVSLQQPPAVRSKTCCDVTERGAKLKFIEEWKKDGWARTDNWVDSTGYNCYQTQLPPTSLV